MLLPKLLRKIWTRLRVRSELNDVFEGAEARKIFLGDKSLVSLTPEAIRRDAARIVKFGETEDYKAFANEAWLDVIDSFDQLMKPNLSEREVDFCRGTLAQSINLLKVLSKAHYKIKEMNESKLKS